MWVVKIPFKFISWNICNLIKSHWQQLQLNVLNLLVAQFLIWIVLFLRFQMIFQLSTHTLNQVHNIKYISITCIFSWGCFYQSYSFHLQLCFMPDEFKFTIFSKSCCSLCFLKTNSFFMDQKFRCKTSPGRAIRNHWTNSKKSMQSYYLFIDKIKFIYVISL